MSRLMLAAIFVFPLVLMGDFPETPKEKKAAYEKAVAREKTYQLEYCERVGKATAKRIKKLKAVIAGEEEDDEFLYDDEGTRYTTSKDHETQLREAREKLKKLKKKKRGLEKGTLEIIPMLRLKDLSFGEIGRIELKSDSRKLKIREILDKRRMAVDLVQEGWVNENGKVVLKDFFRAVVVLQGLDTRRYTEGDKFEITDLFMVTQQTRYTMKTDHQGKPNQRDRNVFVLMRFEKD